MATIRKHRDKYQVQIRRQGFPSVSRTFHKLADAKEWARLMETKADRQELAPSRKELASVSLGSVIDRYIAEVLPRKKGADIERIILRAFRRHRICRKSLAEINTTDFAEYRDERLKTISAKSLKRQLSPVSNMFEVARNEWGLPLPSNPLTTLSLKVRDNKRTRRLRDGELEALQSAAARTRNPLVMPCIVFALETAMRRGEILALRWQDIDLPRSALTIHESKNGYSRTIPLTTRAIAVLDEVRLLVDGGVRQQVFPMSPIALRLAWDRLTTRAGIDDLNFHDLRHEAISRFFELGLTTPEVASISGHRDMRMLFRYAHASQARLAEKLSQTR
ncbi:site-specific integrase [Aquamicrobium zhengzhouense]|uniref:Site-specific integrase n=1 Tax=Aquamicrobium zhengzhouense TaxID=2781738 RepID=A0ABS0SA26_9HYPH|nr:site-specific integrase [Aquamicrobium zhengzhouense]MBI1619674.1 site-specific integrase [Aquamicrobium zhengzhouense]